MEEVSCKRMQQQQRTVHPARRSRHGSVLRAVRIILFIVTLFAVIVTGIFIIIKGATSTPTILSGILTIILGVVAVIQIHPILFPPSSGSTTSTGNAPPSPTPNQNPNANTVQPIFQFNLPLRDPNEYYGRIAARNTLITRVSNRGSSSIVGERRMGKTWLLTYLQLVAPTHGTLGSAYRIGYVSASHPQSKTIASFVLRALDELKVPQHSIDLSQSPLSQFSRGVQDLKKQGIFPVLCIDEFDGFDNRQEFTHEFMEGLRALAQDDGLVLVTASKRPLKEIIENLTGQTSPLFNIVQQIRLQPFTENEARDFVHDKSDRAGFNTKEHDYFLRCSTLYNTNGESYWPPLLLQLVGQMLLDDKQAAQGNAVVFQVNDVRYQSDFKRRLDEAYQAVVR
jgi:AAA domain